MNILKGMIKFDEDYFTVESVRIEKKKAKRGKDTIGKQSVTIMTESTPLEDIDIRKTVRHCRYFKAKVLDTHVSGETNQTIKESIDNK